MQEIFRFDGGAFRKSESDAYEEPAKRNLRMCVSASSRLVRVLPPTVPTSTSTYENLLILLSTWSQFYDGR